MGENSGVQGGFKCCLMCMRYCFEKHGDFGRQEAEQLFSAPSFSSLIKASHIAGTKFLVCRKLTESSIILSVLSSLMIECISLLRDTSNFMLV